MKDELKSLNREIATYQYVPVEGSLLQHHLLERLWNRQKEILFTFNNDDADLCLEQANIRPEYSAYLKENADIQFTVGETTIYLLIN